MEDKVVIALIILFLSWGMIAYAAFSVGKSWGGQYLLDRLTYENYSSSNSGRLSKYDKLLLSIRGALRKYHSSFFQDKWITETIFPNVANGFYVDVGSGDGVRQSNTKVLDDLGWKGICIDPFPMNMESRTAQVFREVISSERGNKVTFIASGFIGGIENYLNSTSLGANQKFPLYAL